MDVVEVINEALIIVMKGNSFHNTASWMEAGCGVCSNHRIGPCHSGLGNWNDHPEVVVNFHQKKYNDSHGPGGWDRTTEEEKLLYLDWLMNESPYKDSFLKKDAQQSLDWGFCVMDGKCAGNVMGGGVVATRRMWEHTLVLSAWYALVQGGMDKNMAYPIAHCMQGRVDKTKNFHWGNQGSGHVTIDAFRFPFTALKNFIEGEPSHLTKPFCKSNNYREYGDMFGYTNSISGAITSLNKLMPKKKAPSANVFAKNAEVYSASFDQAIQDMLSLLPTIKEKCGIE